MGQDPSAGKLPALLGVGRQAGEMWHCTFSLPTLRNPSTQPRPTMARDLTGTQMPATAQSKTEQAPAGSPETPLWHLKAATLGPSL